MQANRPAFIVAAAFFLEVLDATIIIPALPAIAANLQQDIASVTVVMAAYVCSLAVFTPVGAYLFQRTDVARKMIFGLLISLSASLICTQSRELGMLLACRVLQGAGSALVVPAGRALVLSQRTKEEIPVLMSYLVWPALFAPIVAPAIGGYLTQQFGWQAIFLFVALLTGLIIVMVRAGIPPAVLDDHQHSARELAHQLIWAAAAIAVFLFFVCASLKQATGAALSLVASIWLLRAFYQRAACQDEGIFGSRLFRLNLVSGSFFRVAIYCFPVLLSLALMTQFGYSPTAAGICLLFIFLGNVLAKPVAAWTLSQKISLRWYFLLTCLVTLLSIVAFLLPWLPQQPVHLYLLCAVHGAARSFLFLGYSSVSFYELERQQLYKANVYVGSMMQVNALIGQAIPALVLIAMQSPALKVLAGKNLLLFSMSIVAALLIVAAASLDRRAFAPQYEAP